MNQNTRQRIIGTVVLAIVAIILLPAIFDGESSYQSSLQTNIPDRPERPMASRELPQRPTIQADSDAILVRDPLSEDRDISQDLPQRPVNATPQLSEADASSSDAGEAEIAADSQSATTGTTASTASTDSSVADSDGSAATSTNGDTTPANVAEAGDAMSAASSEDDVPGLDASGLPEAWSVRVGAFGNTTNASNLTQRLTEGGHRAYTRQVSSSGRQLTAVFVGPLISRQQAQTVLEQVKRDYELNGMIVRYEIEGP